jgi:sugar phosphate isomerase/epimerase
MDRRSFLLATGAAGVAAAWTTLGCAQRSAVLTGDPAGPPSFPLGSVGLQLYTVRNLMQRNVDETLQQVAAAGYTLVETAGLYDRTPAAFRASLDRYGLRTASGHYPLEQLQTTPDVVFATAHALGQEYVIVPFLPPALRSSIAAYAALGDQFNRLGEQCRAAGLRFAYHNHNFEFETFGGTASAYDTLLARTDPALVSFELDVYWAYKAGQDPLRYFERYPGRFALCHVKDGTAPPDRAMADVGAGVIDFAGLFARARTAGLRYAIVEHDQPADPLASIRASHEHLARLLRAG